MNEAIVLPDGTRIQAIPGKYRIVPPPDLNEVVERRFLLEYDFPFLIVREMAMRGGSVADSLKLQDKQETGAYSIQTSGETSAILEPDINSTNHHPLELYVHCTPESEITNRPCYATPA
ncbi:unnamed protein product [Phytophthora lilii]|uniref:Unnamed protein product n=1 Tax=Phytophthora lilii TaxID=2077276 RepID=A0A9W7CIA7_9STRA|nr:unnamed protein product [Phytophthora lilii]